MNEEIEVIYMMVFFPVLISEKNIFFRHSYKFVLY